MHSFRRSLPTLGAALVLLAAGPARAMPGGQDEAWAFKEEDRAAARAAAERLATEVARSVRALSDPEAARRFLAAQMAQYAARLEAFDAPMAQARNRCALVADRVEKIADMLGRAERTLAKLEDEGPVGAGEAKGGPGLGLADARTLRDRLREKLLKAELELEQAGLDRWRCEHDTVTFTHLVQSLRALAAAGEAPAAGPGRASEGGARPERKDGSAPAGKGGPGSRPGHPFFAWTRRHGPGSLVRFTPGSQAWSRLPERICRSHDGWIHWMEPGQGLVGFLNPSGRHLTRQGLPAEGQGLVIHDWRPADRGINILASRGGQAFLACQRSDEPDARILPLPKEMTDAPIVMDLLRWPAKTQLMVFLPRQLLVRGLTDPAWTVFRNPEGPALHAGARVVASTVHGCWLVDRQSGQLLALKDPDPKTGTYALATANGSGHAHDLAFSAPGAGQEAYLYVTHPARDLVSRYSLPDGKGEAIPLRPGSAPGAIVAAPGGAMLVAVADGIGRIDPDGTVTRLPIRGGRVAPLDLHPAYESGRLFFTERGKPFLNALVLGEPGRLDADASLLGKATGPSLLAETAAGDEPEAEPARPKPARAGAGAGGKTAPAPRAGAVPGLEADAGGAGAEAEPEPETGSEPEAETGEPEDDPRETKSSGPAEGAGAGPAPPAGWVPRLVNDRIPPGALGHIRDEHSWSDTLRYTEGGQVKGQFLERWLGSRHTFTKRILFRAANSRLAKDWYEGPEDHVIECSLAVTVGRACRTNSGVWEETRRVRVVLRIDKDTGEEELVTAYPVPEPES